MIQSFEIERERERFPEVPVEYGFCFCSNWEIHSNFWKEETYSVGFRVWACFKFWPKFVIGLLVSFVSFSFS